jgi:hypothetical protein
MRKYNILIKVRNDKRVHVIENFYRTDVRSSIIDNIDIEFLKELIVGEERSFWELEEEVKERKSYVGERDGKYKILSGEIGEIIEEIGNILLLGEII